MASKPDSTGRHALALSLLLAAATLAAFWPVHTFEFTNYDDSHYIYDNPVVRSGLSWGTIAWALTTTWFSYWHPLTWLSHALDCTLFGLRPGAHHLMSLGLHVLNTVVLFLALRWMTGATARSAMVAALFALHPMHVESVAWLSERKDLLSGFFWITTIWAYAGYAARPTAGRYSLALLLCAAGLMSKPMVVTLPCVLLLMDYWPLRRLSFGTGTTPPAGFPGSWWRLILEKVPFFVLAGATSLIAYVGTKRAGNVLDADVLPWSFRLANVPVSYARYLGKLFLPEDMTVLYPIPSGWQLWQVAGSSILVILICLVAAAFARSKPYLLVGWLWFLGTLVPTLSLVAVGYQSLADRYTYISYIGLFLMLVWGLGDLVRRATAWEPVLKVASVLVLAALFMVTRHQLQFWRNSLALWSHAVAVTQNNVIAHYNLGHVLHHSGRPEQASHHYREALRVDPAHPDANLNLGVLLREAGKLRESTNCITQALTRRPTDHKAHMNLGIALFELGDVNRATNYLASAVQLATNDPLAAFNYGKALLELGDPGSAAEQARRALRADPAHYRAHACLGEALAAQGQDEQARAHLVEALRLKPDYIPARFALGNLAMAAGRLDQAAEEFRRVLETDPASAEAHFKLGRVAASQGQPAAALQHYRASLRLNPDSPYTLNNLAWLQATHPRDDLRNGAEAISFAERACELTGHREPIFIGTLAAAQAEAGDFTAAVRSAMQARDLAQSLGRDELARLNQQLGEHFTRRQPWREEAR